MGASVHIPNSYTGASLLDIAVARKNLELVKLFLRYGAVVTPDMLQRKKWEGTVLLQEVYNEQEQKRRKQKEIEEANQRIAQCCCICLEEKKGAKNLMCYGKINHPDVLICNECFQSLRNTNQPCPICRANLKDC